MERDTRRLALISVGFGIAIVTLLPNHAGLANGLRPATIGSLGEALIGNLRETDLFDVVQNVLLYLPLGFLAADRPVIPGAVTKRGRNNRLAQAGFLGLILSVLLETCQMWIPGRWCSLSDVVTNGLGAYLGGLAALSLSLGNAADANDACGP